MWPLEKHNGPARKEVSRCQHARPGKAPPRPRRQRSRLPRPPRRRNSGRTGNASEKAEELTQVRVVLPFSSGRRLAVSFCAAPGADRAGHEAYAFDTRKSPLLPFKVRGGRPSGLPACLPPWILRADWPERGTSTAVSRWASSPEGAGGNARASRCGKENTRVDGLSGDTCVSSCTSEKQLWKLARFDEAPRTWRAFSFFVSHGADPPSW